MVAFVIPSGYGEDVVAGQPPTVRLILNGAESVNSLEAQRAAQQIIFEQGMRERFNLEPEAYAADLPQITVKYGSTRKSVKIASTTSILGQNL